MRQTLNLQNLEEKIDRITESGCWIWMGSLDKHGYARMSINSRSKLAHRLVFELARETIPNGLQIDHLCRVRCCVNPWHLEIVTSRENSLRGFGQGALNARKTKCKNGHEFDIKVFRDDRIVKRHCSICLRAKYRKSYLKKKEKNPFYWMP